MMLMGRKCEKKKEPQLELNQKHPTTSCSVRKSCHCSCGSSCSDCSECMGDLTLPGSPLSPCDCCPSISPKMSTSAVRTLSLASTSAAAGNHAIAHSNGVYSSKQQTTEGSKKSYALTKEVQIFLKLDAIPLSQPSAFTFSPAEDRFYVHEHRHTRSYRFSLFHSLFTERVEQKMVASTIFPTLMAGLKAKKNLHVYALGEDRLGNCRTMFGKESNPGVIPHFCTQFIKQASLELALGTVELDVQVYELSPGQPNDWEGGMEQRKIKTLADFLGLVRHITGLNSDSGETISPSPSDNCHRVLHLRIRRMSGSTREEQHIRFVEIASIKHFYNPDKNVAEQVEEYIDYFRLYLGQKLDSSSLIDSLSVTPSNNSPKPLMGLILEGLNEERAPMTTIIATVSPSFGNPHSFAILEFLSTLGPLFAGYQSKMRKERQATDNGRKAVTSATGLVNCERTHSSKDMVNAAISAQSPPRNKRPLFSPASKPSHQQHPRSKSLAPRAPTCNGISHTVSSSNGQRDSQRGEKESSSNHLWRTTQPGEGPSTTAAVALPARCPFVVQLMPDPAENIVLECAKSMSLNSRGLSLPADEESNCRARISIDRQRKIWVEVLDGKIVLHGRLCRRGDYEIQHGAVIAMSRRRIYYFFGDPKQDYATVPSFEKALMACLDMLFLREEELYEGRVLAEFENQYAQHSSEGMTLNRESMLAQEVLAELSRFTVNAERDVKEKKNHEDASGNKIGGVSSADEDAENNDPEKILKLMRAMKKHVVEAFTNQEKPKLDEEGNSRYSRLRLEIHMCNDVLSYFTQNRMIFLKIHYDPKFNPSIKVRIYRLSRAAFAELSTCDFQMFHWKLHDIYAKCTTSKEGEEQFKLLLENNILRTDEVPVLMWKKLSGEPIVAAGSRSRSPAPSTSTAHSTELATTNSNRRKKTNGGLPTALMHPQATSTPAAKATKSQPSKSSAAFFTGGELGNWLVAMGQDKSCTSKAAKMASISHASPGLHTSLMPIDLSAITTAAGRGKRELAQLSSSFNSKGGRIPVWRSDVTAPIAKNSPPAALPESRLTTTGEAPAKREKKSNAVVPVQTAPPTSSFATKPGIHLSATGQVNGGVVGASPVIKRGRGRPRKILPSPRTTIVAASAGGAHSTQSNIPTTLPSSRKTSSDMNLNSLIEESASSPETNQLLFNMHLSQKTAVQPSSSKPTSRVRALVEEPDLHEWAAYLEENSTQRAVQQRNGNGRQRSQSVHPKQLESRPESRGKGPKRSGPRGGAIIRSRSIDSRKKRASSEAPRQTPELEAQLQRMEHEDTDVAEHYGETVEIDSLINRGAATLRKPRKKRTCTLKQRLAGPSGISTTSAASAATKRKRGESAKPQGGRTVASKVKGQSMPAPVAAKKPRLSASTIDSSLSPQPEDRRKRSTTLGPIDTSMSYRTRGRSMRRTRRSGTSDSEALAQQLSVQGGMNKKKKK